MLKLSVLHLDNAAVWEAGCERSLFLPSPCSRVGAPPGTRGSDASPPAAPATGTSSVWPALSNPLIQSPFCLVSVQSKNNKEFHFFFNSGQLCFTVAHVWTRTDHSSMFYSLLDDIKVIDECAP